MTPAELTAASVLGILGVLIGVPVMMATTTRWVAVGALPKCGRCAYDLSGLDPGARCPECGDTAREWTWCRRVDWDQVRRFSRWLVLFTAAAIALPPLLRFGWAGLYLVEGWPTSVAVEIGLRSSDLTQALVWAGVPVLAAFAAAAPLAASFPRRRERSVFAGLFAAAVLACTGGMLAAWLSGGIEWEVQVREGPLFHGALVAIIAGMVVSVTMNGRRPRPSRRG